MPLFVQSEKNTDCGPVALRMVLNYLGGEYSIETEHKSDNSFVSVSQLREPKVLGAIKNWKFLRRPNKTQGFWDKINSLSDSERGGSTWTIDLAKIAAELGFKVEFYSKSLEVNPENFALDFYNRETGGFDSSKNKLDKIIGRCKALSVHLEEKSFGLEELLSKINEDCLAIVLLDWYRLFDMEGYQGHFVPIVGYDEKNVYVNNPDFRKPVKDFAISKEKFDEARRALGTDEDVILVYRKI